MRQPQQKLRRNRISQTKSIPAPIGGWNARDALGDMGETDAIQLTNWFPTPSQVMLRFGFTNYSTGLPGQVNSVMKYNGAGTQKLFAASQSGIYDCTAGGAVGAAVQTGLTSDKFIHTNFATAGGNFLLMVNGADKLHGYNGSVWWTDGDATHDITGFDTSTASFIYPAKSRIWMIQKNSLKVWYLGVSAIAGAATSIDFSSLCRKGGTLVSMTEWTVTGGFGATDYVVFITSEGEMLLYQGTDPSSTSTWSLIGIWAFGSPMGNKCFTKYGTDVLYIAKDGLEALSQDRFFAEVSNKGTMTDKIQWAISDATTLYASNFGWICIPFPLQNMLILNIPKGTGLQEQYVMNSVTGAWCNFTGWNANTWEMYNDQIYFGGNGVVSLAWNTNSDNSTQITGDAIQAPNYFGERGLLKQWTMMRPILSSSGVPAIYANINIDFDTTPPSSLLNYTSSTGSLWDVALWDTGTWGQGTSIYKTWQGINGIGYSASPRFKAGASGISVNWISTDFVYEIGGIL